MKDTKSVKIGNVMCGGSAPVSVQTMYDIPLSSLEPDFDTRMSVLKAMGCDIIRFSYPDINEHEILCDVVKRCPMPVVADIHFDWRNALDAVDCRVAKIRINPGNIGARWKTEEIVRKASDNGTAIRIGLNGGSLPSDEKNRDTASLMVDTALEYISWFEKLGFYNTVVSLKASDAETSYRAYSMFAKQSDYPLHLGVTEAGGTVSSCVRTTYALSGLLDKGIGNTLRYSITGSIEDEVSAGVELLRTMGLRKGGVRIVSCPTCGRKSFDSRSFLASVQSELLATGKNICVAIMGCQVNGPGEAKGADVAVTGIGNSVFLYRKGEIYRKVSAESAKEELLKLVSEF
ncbi:MAG: flavodoxin-dependent (E)-4-hydroxy-3-methylbut-2-enyl-diphosphate synthase [Sphaerochaetaceae bacterium]|nr:flavodoxin-dependent (E)-4-hydroxy-3-methylbut-2-enyl-diphosphate synthase [Sphaerochaetaceae bacterium]